MGYATNVLISLPMSVIIYMLTEKTIINITSDNKFKDKVQKSFIIGFIIGLLYIALALTVFSKTSKINNEIIQLALHLCGIYLILVSVVFNWDELDEDTKIIMLTLSMIGCIIYSYKQRNAD